MARHFDKSLLANQWWFLYIICVMARFLVKDLLEIYARCQFSVLR
jgi:hypothetical protein